MAKIYYVGIVERALITPQLKRKHDFILAVVFQMNYIRLGHLASSRHNFDLRGRNSDNNKNKRSTCPIDFSNLKRVIFILSHVNIL